MKIYDVSVLLSPETPVYEGDPPVTITATARMDQGAPANVSRLTLGSHSATHIDAPYHFLPQGARTEDLSLETLIGPALVCQVRAPQAITRADLLECHIPYGTERLLLKTKNSTLWERPGFHRDFVYLTPEGARYLVERKIKLVGIDYLSVEAFGSADFSTHRTLLEAGVIIVEGLDLRQVPPGQYTFICLPLKVAAGDGAPARAILLEGRP